MFGKTANIEIQGDNNLVIQDIDGSTVTVNMNNPEEIRLFFIEFNEKLKELPANILNQLIEHQKLESPITVGANIYLGTNIIFGRGGRDYMDSAIGITITNLTKDIRYFNQPYFQTEPAIETPFGAASNTFYLVDYWEQQNIVFPYRMEYGQVLSITFKIKDTLLAMIENTVASSPDAYIQAFVTTTVGETYSSKQLNLSKVSTDLRKVRK